MATSLIPFLFYITNPMQYARSLVIQAVDYATALGYFNAKYSASSWVMAKVTNQTTGAIVFPAPTT